MNTALYSKTQYILDVWSLILPYRRQFFIGVFLRLTSDIAKLFPAIALSQIVQILTTYSPSQLSVIIKILAVYVLLTFYFSWAHNLSKFFGYRVAEKAALDMFQKCLRHIFYLDLAWQETENSGNKIKRIEKAADGVNMSIRRIFDTLIEVSVNTFGIVIIFFTVEKTLSFALLPFILTYFVIGRALIKRSAAQEKIVSKKWEELGGITFESLNSMQTVKSLGIADGLISIINTKIKMLNKEIQKRVWLFQSQGILLKMVEYLFEVGIILFLLSQIITGKQELALLLLFTGLFGKVVTSTYELTDVVQQLTLAKIWMSRAAEILNTQPTIEHTQTQNLQHPYPSQWQKLTIDAVQFKYEGGQALNQISMEINRGNKVGIVGLSGAGKSTLFKLLLDLYENYEGTIYFDDVSLKQMNRQSYINHVAVVLQDTELFNMTLRENIEIAAVDGKVLPVEKLAEVIQMAHLDEVVKDLPKGWDTIIGEKGIKLSGGQRQRLGIARALYREPEILLLDEATSHLDAHSEKEIQNALETCMQNTTTIVIAHRLSTIKAMDTIIVLSQGVVAESGTFDELLAKNGVFAQMWKEQKI